jgi:hypothetical protein
MIGRYIYRHRLMGRIMKYTVEMGSGAIIYIPSFIKIGSAIQNLRAVIYRQYGNRISLLLFFSK